MSEVPPGQAYRIEVITLPVSDVDKALDFYTRQAGFSLDVDYHPVNGFRVVQLTPPGSACSVQLGEGLTDAAPGSARATYLVVPDIEAACRGLASAPELVNSDPYGEGWMFDAEAEPSVLNQQFAELLDASAYRALTGE